MQPLPILGQTFTLSSVLESTFPASTDNNSSLTSSTLIPSPTTVNDSSLATDPTTNDDSITAIAANRATLPAKRGHKLQVASACSNCKKAHLACDVSRPCKRCISLGKTDTCVDIEHKKRGRPKLLNKKTTTTSTGTSTTATNSFEVMRGTIQTPIFTNDTSTDTYSRPEPSEQPRPLKQISFCHQPIESFHHSRQGNTEHKPADTVQLTPIELTTPSSPASIISRTDSSMTAIDFDYLNEPLLSSFSPPSSPLSIPLSSSSTATKVTLILSMELCCARISEDITKCWGYYPQELAHRSIYDFIAPENITRLSQLHRQLLDNAVEGTSRKDPSQSQQHAPPPPTERTTSDIFHQKTMDDLTIVANGAETIMDSLLIKTRSGAKEWYDICVHAGGGLGADLEDASTLTKLYIVMTCQKKINMATTGNHHHHQPLRPHHKQTPPRLQQRPTPTYRSILPLLSPASASTTSTATTNQVDRPCPPSSLRPWHRYAVYGNRPIRPAPHDLRRVSLPAHFANNSKLNTISFNNSLESPKINVAPTTTTTMTTLHTESLQNTAPPASSSSSSSSSSPSIPCTYFRPIAAASTTISVSSAAATTTTHLPSRLGHASLHNNNYPPPRHWHQQPHQHQQQQKRPFTTIAYRYAPQASTGPRETPAVTHPTTQYFLQTSSSTLNAASDHSRRASSSSHPTASSSDISSRKQGISIRSLLC